MVFRFFNFVVEFATFRGRDLAGNGGLVVQLQFGRFSPPARRYIVWKNGRPTTHNGRVPTAMDPRYAKTQHPEKATRVG